MGQTTVQLTKIDSKGVTGVYLEEGIYAKHKRIRITKLHRYRRYEWAYKSTWEKSVGKWRIQNDTLILTEKFYKHKEYPSKHRIKIKNCNGQIRNQVTKLIQYKGKWMELDGSKYVAKAVYTQYVLKGLAWKPMYLTTIP